MGGLNSKYVIPLLLIILFLSGCHWSQTGVWPVSYTTLQLDSCRNEPDHHYYISMPETIADHQKLPLIIAIEPHGDGKLASQEFSDALVDIPAVIAGSDKIQNNYRNFESSISNLLADVLDKYPVNPDQVIIAGFSGGARMAFFYGMNHKVRGILMYGAGPDQANRNKVNIRVYAVSGTRDFNFMEQYLPPFSNLDEDPEYMFDYFRGSHEWPPPAYIYESVAYLLKDEPDFPAGLSKRMYDTFLLQYDSLLNSDDLIFASKALEKAWAFSPDRKGKSRVSRKIDELESMPGWLNYSKKFESYLQKEIEMKQAFVNKLTHPDTVWWKKEMTSLNQTILSNPDPVIEDYLYRIKGFVGIILYSRINTLLQADRQSEELSNLLVIYEMAEPESPDLTNFKNRVRHLPANN